MSEVIFDAIDKVSDKGLESMLNEVVRVGSDEHDYSRVWQARYYLKRLELGLESKAGFEGREDAWKQLNEARNQFRAEAAEHYKADGNLAEAASNFLGAGRYKDAVDMYLQEGSDESLDRAAFWAINSGVDYKLGFDLRIQKGQIDKAFNDLKRIRFSEKFGVEDEQKWGEYLTRAAYKEVIKRLKAEIEKIADGKPEGETIPKVLEGNEKHYLFVGSLDIDDDFKKSIGYAKMSNDPEIIQIGIELNDLKDRMDTRRDIRDMSKYEETRMYLKGRLGDGEEGIQYFIKRAEQTAPMLEKGHENYDAENAVELLMHHQNYDRALEVAEKFLFPNHRKRFEILEILDDNQKLAAAYRQTNDPIMYALTIAKANQIRQKNV